MARLIVAVGLVILCASPARARQWVCTAPVGEPIPDCFVVDSIAYGVVMDGTTGDPLQGARVEALERGVEALTDSTGAYSIENVAPGFALLVEHPCYYSVRLARPYRLDLPINVGLPRRSSPECPATARDYVLSHGNWALSGHMHSADPMVTSSSMWPNGRVEALGTSGSLVDESTGAYFVQLPPDGASLDLEFVGPCLIQLTVLGIVPSPQRTVVDVRVAWRWDPKYSDLEGCGLRDPVHR